MECEHARSRPIDNLLGWSEAIRIIDVSRDKEDYKKTLLEIIGKIQNLTRVVSPQCSMMRKDTFG